MGEEAWRVHTVGSPSLDHLTKQTLYTREEVERRLRVPLDKETIAVIYHPVTMERDTLLEVSALLAALERIPQQLLFISPNADAGSRALIDRIHMFISGRRNASFITNIEHVTYLSLLQHLALLVGNSSSGIMEATSFRLPVVNIGLRQKGRERAENVLDCRAEYTEIENAIALAQSGVFRASLRDLVNPYGDGHSAEKIARILTRVSLSESLRVKEPAPIRPLEEYEHSAR